MADVEQDYKTACSMPGNSMPSHSFVSVTTDTMHCLVKDITLETENNCSKTEGVYYNQIFIKTT